MSDMQFKLEPNEIHKGSEIKGTIMVAYPGRYDGVVINVTIFDSNEHIKYTSYNDKKISQNVSRLFINRDSMPKDIAEFTGIIDFETETIHEVKFRVSIIEQHKELFSLCIQNVLSGRVLSVKRLSLHKAQLILSKKTVQLLGLISLFGTFVLYSEKFVTVILYSLLIFL